MTSVEKWKLSSKCRMFGGEWFCSSYPLCDCDRYTHRDVALTKKTADKITNDRKEHTPMDVANAKIVVGNRVYPARSVNYECSIGEYPEIEVEAILDPFRATPYHENPTNLSITNVIFNPPATIVFWSDKTKTVVKCDYDQESYDPEKGLAMAISKKMLANNKREYYHVFLHWLKKWNKQKNLSPTDDTTIDYDWDGDFANA